VKPAFTNSVRTVPIADMISSIVAKPSKANSSPIETVSIILQSLVKALMIFVVSLEIEDREGIVMKSFRPWDWMAGRIRARMEQSVL